MVGQGKRAGAGKKAPGPPPNPEESYIVFTNSKDDGKDGKNNSVKSKNAEKQDGLNVDKPPTEDAPKKSDTRKLIGGASWTGKLPVNLLSEHCQKQKWEKPEYSMVCMESQSYLATSLSNLSRAKPRMAFRPWSYSRP